MTEETPQLSNAGKLAWYQGLSRTQWWVLIIASMGWMFDTMDQQFFNLGRGVAMEEVLEYDASGPALAYLQEKVDEPIGLHVTADQLDGWVQKGVITAEIRDKILRDSKGGLRDKVARRQVAQVVGREMGLRSDTFLTMGARKLDEEQATGDAFDKAALDRLVSRNVLTPEAAERMLKEHDGAAVPRDDLAKHIGQQLAKAEADAAGDRATLIFVMGWAIGGLFFGWVGDALGRAKTMALTILTYALFTGLNGLAQTQFQFDVLRFLTALGVGGEFAAGAALVAESMPDRSRAAALGTLQALSAVGNMAAAALAFFIMPVLGWRWLFAVGALPGVVAVFVFVALKEPEKWREARRKWLEEKAAGITHKKASYMGLLQDSRWRKRAIVGLLLGVVGVGGLWGVGFFTPELNRMIAKNYSEEAKERFVAIAFFLQQLGAFFGISAYTVLSLRMGRKPAFAFFFVIAFLVVSYTFLFANTIAEAYILAPLVGFVTLGPFGGYAIYFPELFPTRLRATGVGFCYNVGRFLAALIPGIKSGLKGLFLSGSLMLPFLPAVAGSAERAIRYGSFLMIFIYLIGLFVLLFAPETKDQPLPED